MDGVLVCIEERCRLGYLSELVNKSFSEIKDDPRNKFLYTIY